MGSRGPVKKAGAARRQRASDVNLRVDTHEAKTGLPPCPDGLDDAARDEWGRICAEMQRAGTLNAVDRAAITEYCLAWAHKRAAERIISQEGFSFETSSGQVKQRPEVNIALRCGGLIQGYLDRFGLTPAGRARMGIEEQAHKPAPVAARRG